MLPQKGLATCLRKTIAAVEYIANKILQAVRGERRQQEITGGKTQPGTRPPEVQSPTEARHKSEKPAPPAGHSERSKLIDELKQMLRDGKAASGVVIDSQLAHEIAKQITILNEDIARSEVTETSKRIRANLARLFGKASAKQPKPPKAAAAAVAEPKRAKSALRASKTKTPRFAAAGAKGSKRRSR